VCEADILKGNWSMIHH